MRNSPVVGSLLGLVCLTLLPGCAPPSRAAAPAGGSGSRFQFSDQAAQAGLEVPLFHGFAGRRHLIEPLTGGCALVDLTGDGLLDAFFVNGARLPGDPGPEGPTFRFFQGTPGGKFEERTSGSGLDVRAFGMGVAAADYDGDGRLDLYVTALGRNYLFQNLGNGRFQDVAEQAGVKDGNFSSGCSFFDADGDGDLDLYVSHYVRYDPKSEPRCEPKPGLYTYCGPDAFQAEPDRFFRNNGDGTFTDATREAGFTESSGKGLGVIAGDYDRDGDLDLYVANDKTPNFLWINDGKGHFTEEGLARGVAVSGTGEEQAGMGVDAADVDGDGLEELVVTNYSQEYNTLYRNQGAAFTDETNGRGLGRSTLLQLAFGVRFLDADLDGAPDLLYANGHVMDNAESLYVGVLSKQALQLFRNDGKGQFTDVSQESGPALQIPMFARGLATGDLDGDGREEVLVTRLGEPALLLRNTQPTSNHWLRVRLRGRKPNFHAIGARVKLVAGGRSQAAEVRSGSSYLCQSDFALTFGLGSANQVSAVEVRWPDGAQESFRVPSPDREVILTYGTGARRWEPAHPEKGRK